MHTITIKIPPELDFRLESAAGQKKTSKSDVVRDLLEQGLNSSRMQKDVSCYDLAKDLCGSIKKAPRDLSINRKYMEDFGK